MPIRIPQEVQKRGTTDNNLKIFFSILNVYLCCDLCLDGSSKGSQHRFSLSSKKIFP